MMFVAESKLSVSGVRFACTVVLVCAVSLFAGCDKKVQVKQPKRRVQQRPVVRNGPVSRKAKTPVRRVVKRAVVRKRPPYKRYRWRRLPGPRRLKKQAPPQKSLFARRSPKQMVATAHPLATKSALRVLRMGGNAMDAAISAAFVLAVVEPYSSGLGGGGFLVAYDAKHDAVDTLDFRERAPFAAKRNLFSRYGKRGKTLSEIGRLAAGTPGMVAGMAEVAHRYSNVPWKELLKDAHLYAKKGFRIHRLLSRYLRYYKWKLRKFRESMRVLFPKGKRLRQGQRLKQPDLAWTLKRIQTIGPRDFYYGEIAKRLDKDMRRGKGIMRLKDLNKYKAYWQKPVIGSYERTLSGKKRKFTIYSMGTPSSGGVHLLQILHILNGFSLPKMAPYSDQRLHLLGESMRLAFADRAKFQGDARFAKVPNKGLISRKYAAALRKKISMEKAAPKGSVKPGAPADFTKHTSHISVIDQWGNAVAMTLTINTTFGSGVIAKNTGVIWNSEMDDFTANPGKPNSYGLMQSDANAIQPGKTPLSCMTPTLVFEDGRLRGSIGSPGGPTIITTVAQIILNLIDHGMSIQRAVRFPRIHHQWKPEVLYVERIRASNRAILRLKRRGHKVKFRSWWGNAMGVWIDDKGMLDGAADPRGDGVADGF